MLDADFLAAEAAELVTALADRWIVVNGAARVAALYRRDYITPLGIEAGRPNVTVAATDYPGTPVHGDIIDDAYDGARYAVREVQPDGHGLYVLLLEKTA